MSERQNTMLLFGVFCVLREAGLPLSVRDYMEGLDALRLMDDPFEELEWVSRPAKEKDAVQIDLSRERIRERRVVSWIFCTLWARSDRERSLVEKALARGIPPPPPVVSLTLARELNLFDFGPQDDEEPPPSDPDKDNAMEAAKEKQKRQRTRTKDEEKSGKDGQGDGDKAPQPPPGFMAQMDDTGQAALPDPDVSVASEDCIYSLSLQPTFTSLWMTTLWRRLFIPRLEEDPNELDAAGTVESAARHGGIVQPVFRMRRVNAARLLCLIDVGLGMAPWRVTLDVMLETFRQESDRYQKVGLAFFGSAPGSMLFASEDLTAPEPIDELLAKHSDIPVLVIGEAGAARSFGRRLDGRMSRFLERLGTGSGRRIVWINPMPKESWAGTAMDRIRSLPNLHALELDAESLIDAIDVLRGVST